MKKSLFETEFEKLNRRSTVERALDDFLDQCIAKEAHIESHHLATKALLERYMAVVRSRNNVRRNWHPEQARVCDIQTLMWMSKDEFKNSLDKRLREALVVTSNGSKVITEMSIQELVFNASRITKVVGTIARKGPESEGRPYRMARVL